MKENNYHARIKRAFVVIMTMVIAMVFCTTNSDVAYADTAKRDALKLKTSSVVVYCRETNQIVYEKNPNKKIDPYSTTKIMTALLGCEQLDLNKTITASTEAASVGESSMGLLPNEKVTVKDLLYGTMLPSGNDAAYVLAETMGGSLPKFAKMMNDRAKKLGCKNTNFVTPNGLVEKNHYSTAYDMMLIFNEALDNKEFVKIAGTKKYNMPATNKKEPVVLHNTCKILKEDKRVFAAKTGSWDFENSIVFAFKDKGLTFIVSMMKSNIDVRDIEAERIIEYVSKDIEKITLKKKGEEVGKCRLKSGKVGKIKGVLGCNAVIFLPDGANKDLIKTNVVFDKDIKAPVSADTKIGRYEVYLDDNKIASIPVVAGDSVDKGFLGISNFKWLMIIVIIVAAIALAAIRFVNKNRRKKLIREKARRELNRKK